MDNVERVARAICAARHIDPDDRVTNLPVQFVGCGSSIRYADSEGETWPAWQSFLIEAEAALKEIKGMVVLIATKEIVTEGAHDAHLAAPSGNNES